MDGQSPGRTHECRAIHSGDIGARCVIRADVACHGSRIDALKEIRKRAVATPAIRHAANLLVDLALQIPRATNPAETGAGSIGIGTVICRREFPLHPFESERGLDGLLTIGGSDRRHGTELAVRISLELILGG